MTVGTIPAGLTQQWSAALLRGARLVWLLDVEAGGRTLRAATEAIALPRNDGSTEVYPAGLDTDGVWADRVGTFDVSPQSMSVSVAVARSAWADLPDELARGLSLALGRASLRVVPTGGTWEESRVVIFGSVRDLQSGRGEDPTEFGVVEDDADAPGLLPDALALVDVPQLVIDGYGNPEHQGEYYPIIIGQPGAGDEEACRALSFGLFVASSGTKNLVVADRPILATSVTIYDEDADDSEAVDVETVADDHGRIITVCDESDLGSLSTLTWDREAPYWLRFEGFGIRDPHTGGALRGAGSVLRWAMEQSGARVDHGRLAAAVPLLDAYLIDAVIQAAPDERVRPLDWIRDHLSPILPIGIRRGPGGLYPVVWRWDATTSETVAVIDVDAARAAPKGVIEWSGRRDIRNEIALAYRTNARTDRYVLRVGLTGDPVRAAADSDLVVDSRCQRSFQSLRQTIPLALTTDVVADTGTAWRVVRWLSARYALPSRLVAYSVPMEWGAGVEDGMPVLIRDQAAGFDGRVGIVESMVWDAGGGIVVGVRIIERAAQEHSI